VDSQLGLTRPPIEAALQGAVLWRTIGNGNSALPPHRRVHPMAGQLEQRLSFCFCRGSARPTEIFFGLLPELISL